MENSVLTFKEYNIAGNVLRAYYDADGKLVFVLDSTVDDRKPNVMIAINPVGDRKWDDILANDYGVDLETVRPKKNNKYQKLDIEYSGLAEYDNLINAYENGDDLTDALTALVHFREDSVRRAAAERLAVAESSAEKARETIASTRASIDELQIKLRQLRTKLSQQKRQIGREPTKKSASKILRTDAQIDATNEKLRRAKKRLANAQRRLITADEDAGAARDILARGPINSHDDVRVDAKSIDTSVVNSDTHTPVTTEYKISYDDIVSDDETDSNDVDEHITINETEPMRPNNIAAMQNDAVVRMVDASESDDDNDYYDDEPKADDMADETQNDQVKPLFDKDPEILDEDIAFKPIEFGVSSPVERADDKENAQMYENVIDDKPLSFTPPIDNNQASTDTVPESQRGPINITPVTDDSDETDTRINSGPVLDTIRSVDMPTPRETDTTDFDTELSHKPREESLPESHVEPETNNMASGAAWPESGRAAETPMPQTTPIMENNMSQINQNANQAPRAVNDMQRPVPPAATLAGAAAVRPVSPITGNNAPTNPAPRKPTFIYYVMLILLIGLSIFTLWLYQKNTDKGGVPDLATTVAEIDETNVVESETDVQSPFIPVEETVQVTETEVVEPIDVTPTPVAEPEPLPESEPEPVVVPEPEPAVEPEPADVVIESIDIISDDTVVATEPEQHIPTEAEILASKPAYNVSQNENMFVAAPEYDTETLQQPTTTSDQATVQKPVTQVTSQTTIVSEQSMPEPTPVVTEALTEFAVAPQQGTLSDAVYNQTSSFETVNNYNDTYEQTDEFVPQSVTSEVWTQQVPVEQANDLPMCPDGTAPDINGCCAGEIYTNMGDKGFNCCPETGGDCFPPLI